MLTIPDTDAVIQKFENHIQRTTIENKEGLVATTTDNLEIIPLKAKVAQLESNVAFNADPAVKCKRHDNNKKTGPKAIATCTVCQKTTKLRSVGLALRTKFEMLSLPLQKPRLRGRRSLRVRVPRPLYLTKCLYLEPRTHSRQWIHDPYY
jgi:hypothetical protein